MKTREELELIVFQMEFFMATQPCPAGGVYNDHPSRTRINSNKEIEYSTPTEFDYDDEPHHYHSYYVCGEWNEDEKYPCPHCGGNGTLLEYYKRQVK